MDQYIDHFRTAYTKPEDAGETDERLVSIVDRMFDRCYAAGEFPQALGVALEAHRLDKVREVFEQCDDQPFLLSHCLALANTIVASKSYRTNVLRVLVEVRAGVECPAVDARKKHYCLVPSR